MTIESNRVIGGVAACLSVTSFGSQIITLYQNTWPNQSEVYWGLSAINTLIGLASLIGFILFLVAMHGFSKDYNEPKIFNRIITGLIIAIAGYTIGVILTISIAFSSIDSLSNLNVSDPFASEVIPSESQITSTIINSIYPILIMFAIVGIFLVLFNVRALNLLGNKSRVSLFQTGAKLLLASALLTLALSIIFVAVFPFFVIPYNEFGIYSLPGGFVQDIAWVLLAIAFFRIQPAASNSGVKQQELENKL